MKTLDKVLNDYYASVKKHLNCPAAEKEHIISDLQSNVSDFLQDKPDADINKVIEHFGAPELFWDEYISSLDGGEVSKRISKSKIIKRVVIIVGAILVAAGIGVCIKIAYDNSKQNLKEKEVVIVHGSTVTDIISE